MTELRNMSESILKHRKLLAYFLIFWALVLIFYAIGENVEYEGRVLEGAESAAFILGSVADVIAGIILALLGVKLLKENFLSSVTKEKLLAYFLIFWAASFFFNGLSMAIDYGRYAGDYTDDAISALSGWINVIAGIVLGLFAAKLLRNNFLKSVTKNKLLAFFLILWAASMFFWGISNVMRYSTELADLTSEDEGYWNYLLGIPAGLADLAAGVVLALLGTKLYNEKFVVSVARNKVIALFLILWAASFFFWGLYDIADWWEFASESAEAAIAAISGFFEVVAAILLAMLGLKIWGQKEKE